MITKFERRMFVAVDAGNFVDYNKMSQWFSNDYRAVTKTPDHYLYRNGLMVPNASWPYSLAPKEDYLSPNLYEFMTDGINTVVKSGPNFQIDYGEFSPFDVPIFDQISLVIPMLSAFKETGNGNSFVHIERLFESLDWDKIRYNPDDDNRLTKFITDLMQTKTYIEGSYHRNLYFTSYKLGHKDSNGVFSTYNDLEWAMGMILNEWGSTVYPYVFTITITHALMEVNDE